MEKNEPMWEEYMMEDAEYCVVAYGIAARVSKNAVTAARANGVKVGLIRPITLWAVPGPRRLPRRQKKGQGVCIRRASMGQMIEDIRLATGCSRPVTLCNRAGGMIPDPEQVLEAIAKSAEVNE